MLMCVCTWSCLTPCYPINCRPPASSVRGIFQQDYWNGLPFPSPGDLPNPVIKLMSLDYCVTWVAGLMLIVINFCYKLVSTTRRYLKSFVFV